ncbi:MAG: putative RDD family membrane protein YckC [Candidatus Azotimanducaceae bacterium]|jgi:uncharacterized RDD family membrane protein YckC
MDSSPSYVGFWSRFVAFVIDSIVASIIIYPFLLLFSEAITMQDIDLNNREQIQAFLNKMLERLAFESLFISIVFVGFWMYFGSSPGKLLFKGYIVDAQTLQPPSRLQLVTRSLGYYISLLFFGMGFIWIGLDSRKQGWHDKLARTVVISRRQADAEAS